MRGPERIPKVNHNLSGGKSLVKKRWRNKVRKKRYQKGCGVGEKKVGKKKQFKFVEGETKFSAV